MPFDFDAYQTKCENLTPEQLHREWENYTRQLSGGATSTATAVLFSPLTAGISLVGLGLSAPRVHNARKKRAIIEAKLQAHGQTHNTRKRDVIAPMAISGTIGGLTLGLAGPGADLIAGEAVGKGAEYAAAHVALDATGAVMEHKHDEHSKHKAEQKMNMQYQSFQTQFIQEQAAQGVYLHPQPPAYQPGQQNPSGQPIQQMQPGSQAYQPLLPQKPDQKYEYVPVPASQTCTVSYQPASHQQAYIPHLAHPHQNMYQQLPPYSPVHLRPHGSIQNSASQHVSVQPQQSSCQPSGNHTYPSPCPTPLPLYSDTVDPWFQEGADPQSHPMSYVVDLKPATVRSTSLSSNLDCTSSVVDLPIDVFELPAEVVTAAVTEDCSASATPSLEEEILILKARILQMEIEKRGGVIDIASAQNTRSEDEADLTSSSQNKESENSISAITENCSQHQVASDDSVPTSEASKDQEQSLRPLPDAVIIVEEPTEYQTPQIEVKIATETVDEFEPLSFYPPPPASPAPPPSLLPHVPILQTTIQEVTILASQMSLDANRTSQAQNPGGLNSTASAPPVDHKDLHIATPNDTPLRQDISQLLLQATQPLEPAPGQASTSPEDQTDHFLPEHPRPSLPPRPQSQASPGTSIAPQNAYPPPPLPQFQAPEPRPQITYQTQYMPQRNGASGSYNPQTYLPPSSKLPQQQSQVQETRPQSIYQPLSFQSTQNPTPTQHQQPQSYPPPPPSPNTQQKYPAPPPRPQSVHPPQSAPLAQINAPTFYHQAVPPRPQSMYQPQYPSTPQNTVPVQQEQQSPAPRPLSVYQPLQFPSAQNAPLPSPPAQTQQQIYAQAQPSKPSQSPIQRQDSGYYSIPPSSRHSSSFSTASFTPSNYGGSPQVLSPQPTGMLSPQSTGSVYHGRSASVSTMGSPMSPQSTQQQQPYFPPPPGTPAPPAQNDYFGSKISGFVSGLKQTQPQQNYQQPSSQAQTQQQQQQQSGNGWQWGIAPQEPNYGAPPPIPQPWK